MLVKRWSRYWSGLFRSLVTENWRFYGVWQESCSAALEINRPTKLQPTVIDFKFISLSAKVMMVCSWDTDRASLSWAESIITVDTRVLNDGGQSDNQNVGEERKIKLTKVRFFFTFSPLIQVQSNPRNRMFKLLRKYLGILISKVFIFRKIVDNLISIVFKYRTP